jgi:glucose/arabinose dehydrogenase
VRLDIRDGRVLEQEDLLTGLGARIRDVRMGPDGALWLLTDAPRGKVYRLQPVQ